MAKIGVQMMMLKKKVEELGVYKVLEELSNIGLTSIEISQIPMTKENVLEFKKAIKDFNITVAAMSASLAPMGEGMKGETLKTDYEKIVSDCKELGCNFLRIGMLPFPAMVSLEKIIEFAKDANEMANRLLKDGIKLYYHNHHIEFEKVNGKYVLDIIRENAPDIGFELDVHWVQRGGENPVNIIKKYAGKVDLLHLKDYKVVRVDMKALDYLAKGDAKGFMQEFTNVVRFAEVGEGSLDFKSIIDVGVESGVKHLLIEQDDTYGVDPFESLKISKDNLIKLGYEKYL